MASPSTSAGAALAPSGVATPVAPLEVSSRSKSRRTGKIGPETKSTLTAGPSPRRKRTRNNGTMHVSAKVDYAMRALLEITRSAGDDSAQLIKGDQLAEAQDIPARFLEGILRQLRQAGIVASQRGAEGGYRLAKPPGEITVADVVRALDGPLADVRGDRPENAEYNGAAEHLKEVWVATRAAVRGVLDHVTLAEICSGKLPDSVTRWTDDPASWSPR